MSHPRIVAGSVLGLAVVVFVSLMVWRLSTPRDQSANEADGKVEAIEQVEQHWQGMLAVSLDGGMPA